MNNGFQEINETELIFVDGGTIWGVISGVGECISGVGGGMSGVALILNPTAPGFSQFAGAVEIGSGIYAFREGVHTIAKNW